MSKIPKPYNPSFIGNSYESFHREEVIKFMKETKPDVFEFYETFDIATLKPIYGVTWLKIKMNN